MRYLRDRRPQGGRRIDQGRGDGAQLPFPGSDEGGGDEVGISARSQERRPEALKPVTSSATRSRSANTSSRTRTAYGLVVGTPFEDVGTTKDAGAVGFYDMTTNARGGSDTFLTENSSGRPGTAQAGDHLGAGRVGGSSAALLGGRTGRRGFLTRPRAVRSPGAGWPPGRRASGGAWAWTPSATSSRFGLALG